MPLWGGLLEVTAVIRVAVDSPVAGGLWQAVGHFDRIPLTDSRADAALSKLFAGQATQVKTWIQFSERYSNQYES